MQIDPLNIHPSIKLAIISMAALLTTCLCFYLMLFLITNEISLPAEIQTITHVNLRIDEHEPVEAVATRKKPQKMLPLEPPPDPNAVAINRTSWVELKAEKPTFGSIADLLGPNDIQLELEAPSSELLPLFVVQPIYPLSAAMREIEGFVIVEFSVQENGNVLNPLVVNSEPEVLFDDAALSAVSKFRFRPREVGGDQMRVDHVQMKFSFSLQALYDVPEPHQKMKDTP